MTPRPFIERTGGFLFRYRIVHPAAPGEGFGTERWPYYTKVGARFSLWFWEHA